MVGGKDNFEADRAAARALMEVAPVIRAAAPASRAFLGRAVRYLVGQAGIRQFLDIGTGLPTAGNTHEVAQAVAPECRVVYVDNDPVVLSHARALLTSSPQGVTSYIDADARDPGTILAEAGAVLDFGTPLAIMMVDLLDFIEDDTAAAAAVSALIDAVPPGSYLAIMHPASDLDPALAEAERLWNQLAAQRVRLRSREAVAGFLAGLELVEPGLVTVPQWRPDPGQPAPEEAIPLYAAVARKRDAPRGASLCPRFSREELGGRFLVLIATENMPRELRTYTGKSAMAASAPMRMKGLYPTRDTGRRPSSKQPGTRRVPIPEFTHREGDAGLRASVRAAVFSSCPWAGNPARFLRGGGRWPGRRVASGRVSAGLAGLARGRGHGSWPREPAPPAGAHTTIPDRTTAPGAASGPLPPSPPCPGQAAPARPAACHRSCWPPSRQSPYARRHRPRPPAPSGPLIPRLRTRVSAQNSSTPAVILPRRRQLFRRPARHLCLGCGHLCPLCGRPGPGGARPRSRGLPAAGTVTPAPRARVSAPRACPALSRPISAGSLATRRHPGLRPCRSSQRRAGRTLIPGCRAGLRLATSGQEALRSLSLWRPAPEGPPPGRRRR
jgi:S-adenosyl methyltransferase